MLYERYFVVRDERVLDFSRRLGGHNFEPPHEHAHNLCRPTKPLATTHRAQSTLR
jgi:hypothetical protein